MYEVYSEICKKLSVQFFNQIFANTEQIENIFANTEQLKLCYFSPIFAKNFSNIKNHQESSKLFSSEQVANATDKTPHNIFIFFELLKLTIDNVPQ